MTTLTETAPADTTTIEPNTPPAPDPTPTPTPAPTPTPTPDPATTLQSELDKTRQALANLSRDRQITRELFALGAIDLDISAAMVERDIAANPNTEIPKLVADLKHRKPSLFRRPGGLDSLNIPAHPAPKPSSTMSPRPADRESDRDRAARDASTTNSRSSLLTYLRLKRQSAD